MLRKQIKKYINKSFKWQKKLQEPPFAFYMQSFSETI